MNRFPKKSLTWLFLVSVVIGLARQPIAFSQEVRRQYQSIYWQSATTALSAQIHAQADFQRALGESAVDFATARKIHAEAFRNEIDNSVAYVQAGWDKKAIYQAEMLKRYIAPLDRDRLIKSKQWGWLENDPNFAPETIQSGGAMNLLLDRLTMTVLTYSYAVSHGQEDQELKKRLKLEPSVLHQLFLKESVGRGAGLRFRADSREALSVDWWPWLFREDRDLLKARKDFESARDEYVKSQQLPEATHRLQRMLDAYWQLKSSLDQWFENKKREPGFVARGNPTHYLDAKRFLASLFGEIHRLQRTGTSILLVGRMKFEGDNLLDLLEFMSKAALKFDAAQIGEEAAYHQVFQMMRDLYVTVDDSWMKDAAEIKKIEKKRHQ